MLSRANEEEAHAIPTNIGGIRILINKNKDYIVCFECREKGHYKSKYLKLIKKKASTVEPKIKEVKPKI